MAFRVLAAVGGTAAAATAAVMSSRGVRADQGSLQQIETPGVEHRFKISDLPVYEEPKLPEYKLILEDSALEPYITPMRESVWNVWDSLNEQRQIVTDKVMVGRAHTMQFVTYLQEDAGAVPRAFFITISGLGGIVAGYRGGMVRKALYSTLALASASALCYPHQAIDISSKAWGETKAQGKKVYIVVFPRTPDKNSTAEKFEQFVEKKFRRIAKDTEPAFQVAEETSKQIVEKVTQVMNIEEGDEKATEDGEEKLEDHGQSSAEDKHMYTTRDSS